MRLNFLPHIPESLERRQAWNRHALEVTFLSDDVEDRRRGWTERFIPEEIDDVVEIPWSRTLAQCTDLLAEYLLEHIATCANAVFRTVRIGMGDRTFVGQVFANRSSAVRSSLTRGRLPPG